MSSFKFKFVLGAALMVTSAFGAMAADLGGDMRGSLKDSYSAPTPARYYLRLDGGYSVSDAPSISLNGNLNCGLAPCGTPTIGGASMDNAWTLGGGVGIYLPHNFRADLTYDHRFKADISASSPVSTFAGRYGVGMTSDIFLANVYYDFVGVHDRIKPYVGAGLGFARNEIDAGSATDTCGCTTISASGASETHVAAAFMAGATVKLRESLSLDAGYRLLYLGEAHTGAPSVTTGGTTVTATDGIYARDLIANEIRVGLRYDLH